MPEEIGEPSPLSTQPGAHADTERYWLRRILWAATATYAIDWALCATLACPAVVWTQPLPSSVTPEEVLVPMRDGVTLATDVYKPVLLQDSTPAPVLLHRTPYDKRQDAMVRIARYFVSNGYIVAIQDCRGRYRSAGVFTKYINEPEDGFDTIEWLSKLPGSTGQVGMWGTSYGAHVQADAAKLSPPHLRTIVVNMGGTSNSWFSTVRNHGAFELKQIVWAFAEAARGTDDPVVREHFAHENVLSWLLALPIRPGLSPLASVPSIENYLLTMMTHSDYDSYWRQKGLNWSEYYDQTADIPMIHISGWFDAYCGSAIDNYVGLSLRKKSPVKLLIGPWVHGGDSTSYAGDVEFGQMAALADFVQGWHLDWFNHFLRGEQNRMNSWPAVRLFVMGTGDGHKDAHNRLFHGGYWLDAPQWPLPDTVLTRFYLHGDGSLRTDAASTDSTPTTYLFDPRHPVPTVGASSASSEPAYSSGAFDQRERPFNPDAHTGFLGSEPPYLLLSARSDVIVFETPPLAIDTTVIGPIRVHLFFSSSALDTDFTAKLIDVYPPSADFPSGFAMNLTDGIVRARYRGNRPQQSLLVPNKVYELDIEPFPTANVFKKGHRLRLDISSSNFPRFDVNPNTGEPLGRHRSMRNAENTVYHDKLRASYIELSMVNSSKPKDEQIRNSKE